MISPRAPLLVFFASSIALPAVGQKNPDVRLDTNPRGTAHSEDQQIAAVGNSVYVTWVDRRYRAIGGYNDIYFNRSLDAGATWLAQDVRLNTGSSPGKAKCSFPQIAAAGASVYVTWSDARNGKDDIYFNRSSDGGKTWFAKDVRLDTDGAGKMVSGTPAITVSGNSVYVVWDDERGVTYFNRSSDSGKTWLAKDVRLDTGKGGGWGGPQIAASGASVYVVWRGTYFNRSLDRGMTWLAQAVRLNTGSGDHPQIATSGTGVYVAWVNQTSRNSDIYFNGSLDGGKTWLAKEVRLDTGTNPGAKRSMAPQIAASGASVYVTWEDEQDSSSDDILFNRSLDGGKTWLARTLRLDTSGASGASESHSPQIAVWGASVYVTWHESPGRYATFFNRSRDLGLTWLKSDVRIPGPKGNNSGTYPKIAASARSVYVTYRSDRHGDKDIYFTIPLGFQPYGTGKAGSGGLVPRLEGMRAPTFGTLVSLDISKGLGGAAGIILAGVGPTTKASIPFLGGTLLVSPPAVSAPFTLGGAVGVPGVGSLSLPLQIPSVPTLTGVNVNFQAGVFDRGATLGLSLTNGIETWIG